MDTIYLLATFAFFLGTYVYGLLAFLLWRKPDKHEGDWVFLLTMVACAYWCLSNVFASSFGTVLEKLQTPVGHFLLQTSYPLLYTVPPAIRHCMVLSKLSLSGGRRWGHLVLNYSGIIPVVYHLWASPKPLPEHYGPAFSILLFSYLPLAIFEIKKRKDLRARYAERGGADLILYAGFGGALFLNAVSSVFCHFLPENADLIALIAKLSALPPAFAVAYGIFRYRFMDIVFKRSLLYSSLGGLFLGCYLLVLHYGGLWLFPEEEFHPVAFAVGVLGLFFAFHLLCHIARDGLQRGIDRSFFRHHLQGAEMLKSFRQTLVTWSDLDHLCGNFTEKITKSFRLSFSAVLLRDGTVYSTNTPVDLAPLSSLLVHSPANFVAVEELADGPLRAAGSSAEVALILTLPCGEQQGWLLIGEKSSRRPFLSEETTLLEAACGQLATAIDNLLLLQAKIVLEREMQHREKLAALGQLAATVAHEIRNPIAGAKCLLQQVEDDIGISSQGKEYIVLALEDLERVEQSIGQLLNFARKEEYQFTELDVTALVQTTVQRFVRQQHIRPLDIQVSVPGPVLAVIDEEKFRRTLLNVLANAVDAVNENGKILVRIETREREIALHVSDSGQGLVPEDHERIFEPFFTRKEKGTGLGLAIAKKVIEGHGGTIAVSSTLGQGTTFTLTVPRQQPEAKAAA